MNEPKQYTWHQRMMMAEETCNVSAGNPAYWPKTAKANSENSNAKRK